MPPKKSSSPARQRRPKSPTGKSRSSSPRKTTRATTPRKTRAKKSISTAVDIITAVEPLKAITPSPVRLRRKMQKFHLVIDLDATFVDTRMDMNSYRNFLNIVNSPEVSEEERRELLSRVCLFKMGESAAWTILRPYTREFLDFATRYFRKVSVWTAGRKDYGETITEILFEAPLQKPNIVFTWNECVKDQVDLSKFRTNEDQVKQFSKKMASPSNKKIDFFAKPLILLAKQDEIDDDIAIFENVEEKSRGRRKKSPSRSRSEFKFSRQDPLSDILLLDDRDDIAIYNPDNLIKIPPFENRLTRSSLFAKDTALEKFAAWLLTDEVLDTDDIRTTSKENIF